MDNNKDCNGNCEHCQNNIHEIQAEFRQRLSNLLEDVLNKITSEMELSEVDIADDMLSQAAVIYAQCEAPMSNAVYHLTRFYEEVEDELISEEIADHSIEVNPTGDSTDNKLN
jgi:uncharacterized membrane-anchored protein